ncbi:MAG: hypothetical protein GEV28_25095 [Actinophytocola sp.]|uniref:DUF6401 family natural product biosynthesis protein n=1 Tax=Actinophytocola sp. TaxID=1872138 RepID=UPI0013219E5D|nr:DUF6401 family natural product biosynthesis protein [Actinophytocola sp.]MPZ83491.1 hypothetical protein [Actinophytocola sp.]
MGVRRLERSARRVLDRLHEQVGAAGLIAAAAIPGLGAVVDQHTAAVRDILTVGVESGAVVVAGSVLLAGYAQGVLDHLRESDRPLRVPADPIGWLHADWVSVRLLAVCALAKDLRPGRPVGSTGNLPSLA